MVLIFMVWEMAWVDLLSPLCLFRDDSLTPKEPIELAENFHSHPPATRKKITRLLKCTRLKFRFLNVFDVLLTDVWTQFQFCKPKWRVLTQNFDFCAKFRRLSKISIFDTEFLTKILTNIDFVPTSRFIPSYWRSGMGRVCMWFPWSKSGNFVKLAKINKNVSII